MKTMTYFMAALALLALMLAGPSVRAQTSGGLSPDDIAARIRPMHPKTLILVFDVTESTRTGGVFGQERAASATLIRQGCTAGDRIVLLAFGTGYRTIFDKILAQPADADALIDQLPAAPAPGAGTNIRLPHLAALRLIRKELPHPGVVVLLTDSYNDRPLTTDPNYPSYLAYYSLKGLTIYPHTPENRDYERLLRTLKAHGQLHQYGVGVGIAPSGRPIERLPVAGQGGDTAAAADETPIVVRPQGQEKPRTGLSLVIGLALGALLLLGSALFLLRSRPMPLRLKLGERGAPRDYRLRPGAQIGLGGTLAAGIDDIFPLAGVPAPVAYVRAERGGATLIPGKADGPSPKLFHNGMAVEGPVRLREGDEVRILVPDSANAPAREHRVHMEDPRGPAF